MQRADVKEVCLRKKISVPGLAIPYRGHLTRRYQKGDSLVSSAAVGMQLHDEEQFSPDDSATLTGQSAVAFSSAFRGTISEGGLLAPVLDLFIPSCFHYSATGNRAQLCTRWASTLPLPRADRHSRS